MCYTVYDAVLQMYVVEVLEPGNNRGKVSSSLIPYPLLSTNSGRKGRVGVTGGKLDYLHYRKILHDLTCWIGVKGERVFVRLGTVWILRNGSDKEEGPCGKEEIEVPLICFYQRGGC